MMTWLLGIAGVLMLGILALVAWVARMTGRLRFRPPISRIAAEHEVPDEVRRRCEEPVSALAALGFEPTSWIHARDVVAEDDGWGHLALMRHAPSGTFGVVRIPRSEGPGVPPSRVSLHSYLADGTAQITACGVDLGFMIPIPGADLVEGASPEPAALLATHLDALAGKAPPVEGLGVEGALARELALDEGYLQALKDEGLVRPARETGEYRLTLKGTTEFVGESNRAAGHIARQRAEGHLPQTSTATAPTKPVSPAEMMMALPADLSVEAEVDAYRRIVERKRKPKPRKVLLAIFAVSAVLFALSFQHIVGIDTVAVLVGVVLFHELGHLFAMRAFGYQDTTVFFIPFVGAAATGRKANPKPFEELVVLLAGPVPGLILAAVLWWGLPPDVTARPSVRTTIGWLVGLNWLNLLPIVPLDGGRVVQLLLTARRPWLDVALRGAGAAAFLAAGYYGESLLMTGFGVLMLGAVRQGYRAAVLRKHLAKAPAEELADEHRRLHLVFDAIRAKGLGHLPPTSRFGLATELTRLSILKPPGFLGVAAGLTFYGFCLASVPVAAILIGFLSGYDLAGDFDDYEPTPFHWDAEEIPPPTTVLSCTDAPPFVERSFEGETLHSTYRWAAQMPSADAAREAAQDPSLGGATSWQNLLFVTAERVVPGVGASQVWIDAGEVERSISAAFRCAAPSEVIAEQVAVPIRRYAEQPHEFELRPPWLPIGKPDPETAAAEQRAWTTYDAVEAAQNALAQQGYYRDIDEFPLASPDATHEERETMVREFQQRMQVKGRALFEEAIERAREERALDEEVVELMRAFWRDGVLAFGSGGDRAAEHARRTDSARRLGARLGQLPMVEGEDGTPVPDPHAKRYAVVTGSAWPHGSEVHLPFTTPVVAADGVPAVAHYLCDAGCTTVDVWLADFDDVRGD